MKPFRLLLILLAVLCLFPMTARADTPDYIRLHIPAHSDSPVDQAIKLGVRDEIRTYTASLLSGVTDADAAWQILCDHREEMEAIARACAASFGFDESVTLDMGVFSFPDRVYGDELVPAGDYRAVRITLGDGAGQNWWCVVYPSLCLPEEADGEGAIQFYSRILRWILKIREAIFS